MHILRLPLAVLAAATLTAACAVPAHAVTGWQPAESVPANAAASSAPYYVIGGVSVVNGFTGATLATIHGPDHRPLIVIGAADDDRTFVLATPTSFYELRLGSQGKPEWLTAVRGKVPPYGIGSVTAVSPDARQVAYTTATGGITVVSLVTGAARSWSSGNGGSATDLSWAGDRYVAFQLKSSIRELDTGAPGHSLLTSRILPVTAPASDGMLSGLFNPVITPDGSKLFAAAWTGPNDSITAEIEEFSVSTGKLLAVVMPPASMPGHGDPCLVVWTDPDGAHAMADCGTDAIINNGVPFSVTLSLPNTSGIDFGGILAW
jgi:hypothetical protein